MALLNAAMDNSVRRAQRVLGDDRLLMLNTDVDTFDFEKALDGGMEAEYDLAMRQVDDFFKNIAAAHASRPQVSVEGRESEESATTLQRHWELFQAQHAQVKMQYNEIRMVLRIGALTVENGVRTPDRLFYRLRFAASKVPLECVSIHIAKPRPAEFLGTLRSSLSDKHGHDLRTIDLRAQDEKQPDMRSYLLFLDPAMQPGDPAGPFMLAYDHKVRELMAPLAERGIDTFGLQTSRAEGPTSKVLLIAVLPNSRSNFRIRASSETTNAANRGRRMEDHELQLLELQLEDEYALGWVAENVGPNEVFAAELYSPNFK
jgi:hypothetical protein